MKFGFKADAEFEAEDIDAVFSLLAYHFAAIAAGMDEQSVFVGEMDIRPVDQIEPSTVISVST